MTTTVTEDLRTRFYRLLPELLAEDARAVAVFGEVRRVSRSVGRGRSPTG